MISKDVKDLTVGDLLSVHEGIIEVVGFPRSTPGHPGFYTVPVKGGVFTAAGTVPLIWEA